MDNCYCCGKRFRDPNNRTEAFLEDDDNRGVMTGPECAKRIRKAGAEGFAPTNGGPRLFWEPADAKAYAKKLRHGFTKHPNIFNNVRAAQTFCSKLAKDCVVVHIGRKFGVVKPDVAKRMKLRRAKSLVL